MAKNLMPEVAKLLGVELGEEFIIENAEHNLQVVLVADGLHVTKDDFLGSFNSKLLKNVLCGLFEVKKLPWEPKEGEVFYFVDVKSNEIIWANWSGNTRDYSMQMAGVIYKTSQEAYSHRVEDYEKLTGKKLE